MSVEMVKLVTDIFVRDQMFKDAGSASLDGHEDTTNVTVMAEFSDLGSRLTRKIVCDGLFHLTVRHPYLHSAFKIVGQSVYQIIFNDVQLPITFHKESKDPEQWRDIVRRDLSQRFTREDLPMWRVSFVQGHKSGQIFLTFHHAICDGLSAAARVNELFTIFAELIEGKKPCDFIVDPEAPKIETLFPANPKLIPKEEKPVVKPFKYKPCFTDFVRLQLDTTLTEAIERFAKSKQITVHAVLYAAYIKAIYEVKRPPFEEFAALSIVSLRKILNAPEAMRPLFTWFVEKVNPETPFLEIALQIHKSLHKMLEDKDYEQSVFEISERLKQDPTPAALLLEKKTPKNLINLSNIGRARVSEDYGPLKITGLDAFGGASPYFDYSYLSGGISMSLAVRTFAGKLRMVACFPNDLANANRRYDDNVRTHMNVLGAIERILKQAVGIPAPKMSFHPLRAKM